MPNNQYRIMEVIPAIDLLEGRCVRLYQGDYQQSEIFSENPTEIARRWESQGATRLHLVDLDGAKQGKPANSEAIAAVVRAVSIPVQVGGGLRDPDAIASLFELGVERAILGTLAVKNPSLVQRLCQNYRDRIVIGIDARNGQVATQGWLETSPISASDLARQMAQFGAAAIIYTDIHRDGTLQGPNVKALRELANAVDIPIIASGGIGSLSDLLSLLALEPLGVKGVIVGRALYTGDVSLPEAVRAIGSGRWQDIPPDNGFSALA
jgi:phosphoribosylformimino-5-aminoimidazole carboxamide ribotide isomerase